MRNILSILVLLISFLSADSEFGKVNALPIVEIDKDKNEAYIYANDLKRGESGLIIRWFDSSHASIVASVAVVDIEGEFAKIAFSIFDALEQEAFPTPLLHPKVGDVVLIRRFYDRALAIAPNQEIYQQITSAYEDISWVHPDLFMAFLISEGKNAPTKGDFRRFCDFYSVGLIYLVNMNSGELLDCQTFVSLQKDYITGRVKDKDTIKPFFSRAGTLENNWMDFITTDVKNYYLYYDKLIKGDDLEGKKGLFGAIVEYFN